MKLSPQLAKTAYLDYRKAERFEEATEFGLKAVEDKPEDANLWLNVSPFLVLTADEATVRDYCQRMASQFAKTTDARESRLTVKVCSLVPDALDRKKLPREVFIKSIEAPSGINNAWGWSIRAMDALRTGDAKLAIEYVDKSTRHTTCGFCQSGQPSDSGVGITSWATTRLLPTPSSRQHR